MGINWLPEAIDLKPDPVSGAAITQLTSAPVVNNNIYCEQPYTSPDSKRIAVIRALDFSLDETYTLLVVDLDRIKFTMVERAIPRSLGNAAWSGYLYYWTTDAKLTRISLMTLEKEVVYVDDGKTAPLLPPHRGVYSVSPDQRYVIYMAITKDGGKPTCSIVRIDLQQKNWKIIFQHEEIVNPHLQFNPVHGRDILVQHNRGSRMDADGTITKFIDPIGTTLFTIDVDGKNQRPLPVGEPVTLGATGHECFMGDTGRVAFTTAWHLENSSLDKRWPQGNLFHAAPGDKKPEVIPTPEHRFNHICVSRCGNFWVCDSYHLGIPGPIPLVIGNFKTGRHATLIQDCKAPCGGAQFTHPHAYFTADTRAVIYNGAPGAVGAPQVYRAKVPDGFLESLS
ncbi:MAG: hypothetical protein IT444_12475 [Phycisphaeraceae bacterium]|nr:hypothetical protein [Phycisphaeraceae bacterium]